MAYIVKVDEKEYKVEIKKESNNLKIQLDDKEFQGEIVSGDTDSQLTLIIDNKPYSIFLDSDSRISVNGEEYATEVIDEQIQKLIKATPEAAHKKEVTITAQMPGLIIEVEVNEGDKITAGQGLIVVEAMKMQNEMNAPRNGVVKKVYVQKGQTVNNRDILIVIE
ncbi:MAG: hypothetical protein KAW92_00725 [Candidatus Cloacimonetes bacterium]|nr:hypothetical protein [Candidatus Cloacimonadota bacterium]